MLILSFWYVLQVNLGIIYLTVALHKIRLLKSRSYSENASLNGLSFMLVRLTIITRGGKGHEY